MDTPPASDAAVMESSPEVPAGSGQVISASTSRVHVHCNACESYLGIFENEWVRLTSSYARPLQQGIHHGTEISQNTRIVPSTTTNRSAEGCTLSDVFCQKCSATVGQYCREAPTVEQHYLEGAYFYKLSKVTLKDSNLEPRDPIFAYGEENTPDRFGSPVPSVVAPDPKWSHPPPVKSHLRNVYHSDGMLPPPSRSSRTPTTVRTSEMPRPSATTPLQQAYVSRATLSARASSTAPQVRPRSVRANNPAETPEGLLALRRVLQRDVEFEKMVRTMENIQRDMREIRQATAPSQSNAIPYTRTQAEDEELQALRAENYALKKVMKNLPPQTQFETPRYMQNDQESFSTPETDSENAPRKRKRGSQVADDSLFYEDDDIVGGHDDFDEPMNETSGLATLERDAEQGYSIWQGEDEGTEGGDYSEENEDGYVNNDRPQSVAQEGTRPDSAAAERHSARSRERRQTLPEDFIREEQRYLHSDSNDENFDPNDPKMKGKQHKRTRSAERRRRERIERQQDSLWKKGVPGGGYENGDGWVEQKRHHSGRFGRKAAVGEGLAVYPKYVNDKLFANGRQIPTTHKRLARELVYLGLDDWIDKDKGDALYRRTIRVARKHYAYHHGGISSKALCQGKYTRKDLEQVGMWDDELFEEINLGEESDVEKLDFPLDPKLRVSMERWKQEGLQAKERMQKATQEAVATSSAGNGEKLDGGAVPNSLDADSTNIAQQSRIFDLTGMTEFSDEDGFGQQLVHQIVPEVPDRVGKHKKFDSIWQAPVPASENPVLSIIQHAEARIKAAEEEMGEPTFKSKKAQRFKTIDEHSVSFPKILSSVPGDTYITPENNKSKRGTRRKAPTADTIRTAAKKGPGTNAADQHWAGGEALKQVEAAPIVPTNYMGVKGYVKDYLALLDLSPTQEISFVRELKAYFAVDKDTGAELSAEQHVAFTDNELMDYAESFLETKVVRVGGSRKIGLDFWPDDGSTNLRYVVDKEAIKKHVHHIVLVRRHNKARNLRYRLNKSLGESLTTNQVLNLAQVRPGRSVEMSMSPALPRPLQQRQFENGLRYEVKPGFAGNQYYFADGVPRTAEAAARLERRFTYKNTRKSLPNSLSHELLRSRDRIRRRATMLDMSASTAEGSALMTPLTREASILPDTILQIASTVSQIAKAFDDTLETTDDDSDASDSSRGIVEEMDIDGTADDLRSAYETLTDQIEPTTKVDLDNAAVSPESQELQPTRTTVIPASEVELTLAMDSTADDGIAVIAGSNVEAVENTIRPVRKSLQHQSARGKPSMPALLTRSAAKAAASAKSTLDLTETKQRAKQPGSEISARRSPTSMSDKENVLPEPETAREDMEPPAKRAKTILKQGPNRPPGQLPRKSAAELDQLVKETMERETRSAARKSARDLCFGPRHS